MSKARNITRTAPAHAGAVLVLLHELWPKNGYAVLAEVGNATGARTKRHADAVVMSLWPSRGLSIFGVEIKVSRSDWLSELRQPEKADEIVKYCDHWYVAVSEAKIVQEGELPPTWGLIACDTGRAKIVKPAPKLEAKDPDRGFIAAMLRRAAEFQVPEAWLASERHRIYTEAEASAKQTYETILEGAKSGYERLKGVVSKFEAETGVNIDGWRSAASAGTFRRLKKALEEGDVQLENTADRLEAAARHIREAAAEIKLSKIAEDAA